MSSFLICHCRVKTETRIRCLKTTLDAMEIYHIVLYCVFFTTLAFISPIDALPEYVNEDLALDSQGTDCQCENGRCFIDKEGHTKCSCKPGFALQDEFTCKPCDCGSLGKCLFVLKSTGEDQYQYQKKCVCNVGCADKEGVCVTCDCGENSVCDFEHGEKKCYCIEGYAEKGGVCQRCDCGFYGKCEFKHGVKKCECEEGYSELNGKCEECDCGDNGTCIIVNGQKSCKCDQGYSVKDEKCEHCDCGDNGTCFFENGEATCKCQPGFLAYDGICLPCDCGPNSEDCGFLLAEKQCKCKDGYADRSGTCEECLCGAHSTFCTFKDNQKTCRCQEGFVQKGETCELGCSLQQPCHNGGHCKDGFCYCLKGTRGVFCEVIDECSNLCPKQNDIKCSYDVRSQKAYCRCLDSNLIYDSKLRQCRIGCSVKIPCQNGGYCKDNFCICIDGTRGVFCEVIDECTNLCPNRSDVKCSYDIQSLKAYCKCLDSDLSYDSKMRQCRKKCGTHYQCIDGQCRNNVCDCNPGTSGDQCEIVDCTTDAIICGNGMTFLRLGEETIFVLNQGNLMKFERQGSVLKYATCSYGKTFKCNNHYNFLIWCGGNTVFVFTPGKTVGRDVLKYVIQNSDGARCS